MMKPVTLHSDFTVMKGNMLCDVGGQRCLNVKMGFLCLYACVYAHV